MNVRIVPKDEICLVFLGMMSPSEFLSVDFIVGDGARDVPFDDCLRKPPKLKQITEMMSIDAVLKKS